MKMKIIDSLAKMLQSQPQSSPNRSSVENLTLSERLIVSSLTSFEHAQFHSLLHLCIPQWQNYEWYKDMVPPFFFELAAKLPFFYARNEVLRYYELVPGVRVAWDDDKLKVKQGIIKYSGSTREIITQFNDETSYITLDMGTIRNDDNLPAQLFASMFGDKNNPGAIFLKEDIREIMLQYCQLWGCVVKRLQKNITMREKLQA